VIYHTATNRKRGVAPRKENVRKGKEGHIQALVKTGKGRTAVLAKNALAVTFKTLMGDRGVPERQLDE